MLQWNYFTRPDRVTSSFTTSEMAKIGVMSAGLAGRNVSEIISREALTRCHILAM